MWKIRMGHRVKFQLEIKTKCNLQVLFSICIRLVPRHSLPFHSSHRRTLVPWTSLVKDLKIWVCETNLFLSQTIRHRFWCTLTCSQSYPSILGCLPLCQNFGKFRLKYKWNTSVQEEIFWKKWSTSRGGPLWPAGPVWPKLAIHFQKCSFPVPLHWEVIKLSVKTKWNVSVWLEILFLSNNVIPFSPG